jgi:hypothetical protein
MIATDRLPWRRDFILLSNPAFDRLLCRRYPPLPGCRDRLTLTVREFNARAGSDSGGPTDGVSFNHAVAAMVACAL